MNSFDFYQEFWSLVDSGLVVFIVIPTPPDIDAVVSAKLLADVLKTKKIPTEIIAKNPLPPFLQPLALNQKISSWPQTAVDSTIIIVDCPSFRQTGFISQLQQSQSTIILVDHHPFSDIHKVTRLIVWDESWSSTAEGLFYLLKAAGKIDHQQATLLLLAIIADTGGFKFNTSSTTLQIASILLSAGADQLWINQFLALPKNSINRLRLFGQTAKDALLIADWQLLLSKIAGDNLTCDDGSQGVVSFLASQDVAPVVMLLAQTRDGIRGYTRSKSKNVDAGRLAKLFGGGGFDRAGGFIIR